MIQACCGLWKDIHAKEGVPFLRTAVMKSELSSLTWIWGNLLYILQSLPSLLCFSSFIPTSVYKCHRPRRHVAWTVVMVSVSSDAQRRVAPLPVARWHKMRGREITTTVAAAAARGVAAPPETLTRAEIAERHNLPDRSGRSARHHGKSVKTEENDSVLAKF